MSAALPSNFSSYPSFNTNESIPSLTAKFGALKISNNGLTANFRQLTISDNGSQSFAAASHSSAFAATQQVVQYQLNPQHQLQGPSAAGGAASSSQQVGSKPQPLLSNGGAAAGANLVQSTIQRLTVVIPAAGQRQSYAAPGKPPGVPANCATTFPLISPPHFYNHSTAAATRSHYPHLKDVPVTPWCDTHNPIPVHASYVTTPLSTPIAPSQANPKTPGFY